MAHQDTEPDRRRKILPIFLNIRKCLGVGKSMYKRLFGTHNRCRGRRQTATPQKETAVGRRIHPKVGAGLSAPAIPQNRPDAGTAKAGIRLFSGNASSSGIHTGKSRKSMHVFEKSMHVFEKSMYVQNISTCVLKKSTHVFKKSTHVFEKSTYVFEKSTYAVKKSTNVFEKSTDVPGSIFHLPFIYINAIIN